MPISPLTPYPLLYPSPSVRFLCVTWWTCQSTPKKSWRSRSDSIVASGQALSVIPRSIRDLLDIRIKPVSGWKVAAPSWFGIPCSVGRATVWFPFADDPGLLHDYSLLALLPRDELADAPPFVYLGAQFLLEYRARALFDCEPGVSSQC